MATDLPDYEKGTPTFQRFFLEDNNDKEESLQSRKGQKVSVEQPREGQKVSKEQPCEGQKVNTEEMQLPTCGKG